MKRTSAVAALALIFCTAADAAVQAEDAWSRAMPPGSRTAAVYMQLSNHSDEERRLLAASAEIAARVEVHEHRHEQGMAKMRRVADFRVPAHGSVTLEPGAYHLMLFDLSHTPRAGSRFTVTLDFGEGELLQVQVDVRSPGY